MAQSASIESYSGLSSMSEFEQHTRDVVMDFMGLVPITCPPSFISFRPFHDTCPYNDPLFQGDVTDGTKSFRISNLSDNSKHRTIIRKSCKLVILEDDETDALPAKPSKSKPKLPKIFQNIARFVKPTRLSSSYSNLQHLVSPSTENQKFANSWKAMASKKSKTPANGYDSVDGPPASIDLSINLVPFNWNFPSNKTSPKSHSDKASKSSRPVQKFQSILRKKSTQLVQRGKKESVYVDVGDVDDIDCMVVRKHLSPAALPLQRELLGLRSRPGTPVLTPHSIVANSLRAIADQVEQEHSDELSRAVGRLVNYEEAQRLGFEELKVVAMEMLKDVTPGWSQVAVPLLLSQMVAMSLLVLGNRSVVSRLVDFTTRFICHNLNSFVVQEGGWTSIRRMKVNELAIENSVSDEDDNDDVGTEL